MAILFVQATQATSGGTQNGSINAAYPSNNTAGNLLICKVRIFDSNPGILPNTVTDSQTNTWVKAFDYLNSTPGGFGTIALWYVENCKAGANTVTMTTSGAHFNRFEMAEYSGIALTSSLETFTHAAGTGTAVNSGNITTTHANDLLIGSSEHDNGGPFVNTANAPWILRAQTDANQDLLCDQIVSVTGTYNFTSTFNSTASWSALIAAFQGAGSTFVPQASAFLVGL